MQNQAAHGCSTQWRKIGLQECGLPTADSVPALCLVQKVKWPYPHHAGLLACRWCHPRTRGNRVRDAEQHYRHSSWRDPDAGV